MILFGYRMYENYKNKEKIDQEVEALERSEAKLDLSSSRM